MVASFVFFSGEFHSNFKRLYVTAVCNLYRVGVQLYALFMLMADHKELHSIIVICRRPVHSPAVTHNSVEGTDFLDPAQASR